MKDDKDGSLLLKTMAAIGAAFSVTFMILQLVPIPYLSGVHIGRESCLLAVWIAMGALSYPRKEVINK